MTWPSSRSTIVVANVAISAALLLVEVAVTRSVATWSNFVAAVPRSVTSLPAAEMIGGAFPASIAAVSVSMSVGIATIA